MRSLIQFGPFTFDPARADLRREGQPVHLQRQPAKALAYLLEHRDRVVTRSELTRQLWADGHHVDFDGGLNYCIRQVRLALGDTAAAPQYVATLPFEGYRWVRAVDEPSESATGESRLRLSRALAKPVPVWGAFVMSTLAVVVATSLGTRIDPISAVRLDVTSVDRAAADLSNWRLAFEALHRLSHVVVEADRRDELPKALESLRQAAARLAGLSS